MAHALISSPGFHSGSHLSSPFGGLRPASSSHGHSLLTPLSQHEVAEDLQPRTGAGHLLHQRINLAYVTQLEVQVRELQDALGASRAEVKTLTCVVQAIKGLSSEISNLNSSHSLLRAAFDKTSGASSSSPLATAALPVPALKAIDYQYVKFWNKKDYTAEKKNRKSSTGFRPNEVNDNVMTWYVEDDTGEPVDGDTVDCMRSYARLIWQMLLDSGIAPTTWADANLVAHNYYEHHMAQRFPVLAYGAGNWKVHMLATDNYSSWYGKRVGRMVKVKPEPVDANRSGIDAKFSNSRAFKRSRSPSATITRSTKKARRIEVEPLGLPSDNEDVNQSSSSTESASNPGSLQGDIAASGGSTLKIADPLADVFSDPSTISSLVPPVDSSIDSSSAMTPTFEPLLPSTGGISTCEGPAATTIGMQNLTAVTMTTEPKTLMKPTAAMPPAVASTTTVVRRSKKAHAGDGTNAKSICKREWVSECGGTEAEFAAYWKALGPNGQHPYEKKSKDLAKAASL